MTAQSEKFPSTLIVKVSIFILIATSWLGTTSVMAQQESDEAVSQGDMNLEEVLVTARKQEESLQHVPVAVTAIGAGEIENLSLQSIDDVARFAPGLSFSKAFGRDTERPVVRGLGNVLAGVQFGVESGAAYFVDGIYYPGDIQALDLGNLERIEVIKGPQSAMYGRNSYSGAINFITKAPSQEFSGDFKASFAEDGEVDVRASISGPLIKDVLSGSLSVRSYEFDGQWINQVTQKTIGDESTKSVSGMLEWTPSEALRVRTRVSYNETDDGTRPLFLQPSTENNCYPGYRSLAYWPTSGSDNNYQYYCGDIQPGIIALNDQADADGIPNVVPGVPLDGLEPWAIILPPYLVPILLPDNPYDLGDGTAFDGVERDVLLASMLISYELDNGYALTLDMAFRDQENRTGSDSDHSSISYKAPFFDALSDGESFFALSQGYNVKDYSTELRIDSPQDASFRWMLGGFYFDQDKDNFDMTFTLGDLDDSMEDLENWAVFGSATWDFAQAWSLTAEMRYMEETKALVDLDTSDGSILFEDEGTWDSFTPRVTLDYQMNDSILLYGVYSQGAKPGGFNGADGEEVGKPTYEQEESTNYEFGFKSRWMDNRVQFNAALYYMELQKIQLTTPVLNPTGALNSIVTNQGEGKVLGFELELTALLTENLMVGATYALADTEFTKGCDDFQWTLTSGGGKFDGSEATSPDFTGNGSCSIKGNHFPLSSKNQASAYFDYHHPISNGLSFFMGADVSYEGKKPVQVHNLAYSPASTLVGARIGIESENWTIALFGKNLTDEDAVPMVTRWLQIPYLVAQPIFGVAPNTAPWYLGADTGFPRAYFGSLRRQRQVGVQLTYHF